MPNHQLTKLSEDLASLIPRFHQKFIHHLHFPIPPNHFFTLVSLYDYGTQTITEISSRLLISKQQMSPIIEKLLKSGYVERQTDPTDKRTAKISITNAGYKLLENHHITMKNLLEKKLTILDDAELQELDKTLISFFHLFNKLP